MRPKRGEKRCEGGLVETGDAKMKRGPLIGLSGVLWHGHLFDPFHHHAMLSIRQAFALALLRQTTRLGKYLLHVKVACLPIREDYCVVTNRHLPSSSSGVAYCLR